MICEGQNFLGKLSDDKTARILEWAAKDQEKKKLLLMRFLNTLANIAS